MAFVCTLDDNGSDYVEFFRSSENAKLYLVPVGFDPETDRSYNLFVTLGPAVGGYDEFSFCLIEYDHDAGAEYTIWSSAEVSQKIPADDRAKILTALLVITGSIAASHRGGRVIMCTFEPVPDGKPLRKYILIARMFESLGYRISMPNVYHGQRMWWMERDIGPAIDNVSDEPFNRSSDGENNEPGKAD